MDVVEGVLGGKNIEIEIGRDKNHERCDYCGEGGEMICCDDCPAAFHFRCAEPPLERDELPSGSWFCWPCKNLKENSKTGTRSSRRKTLFDPLHTTLNSVCPKEFHIPPSFFTEIAKG